MSTLYITQKYYDKFLETDSKKVIQLYGFKDRNIYFDSIIKFLNSKYSFLKIENLQIMPSSETSTYYMYNGYVKGDLGGYDEFLVSFSDPYTKEGNTIISQQLMPMLQNRITADKNFLYNKKIKRVFLLTSHKATSFNGSDNSIKEDSRGSTLQLLVRCLVTLGFDVYSFIPVLNLNIGPKYENVQELLGDIDYIQSQNSGNLQHKHIRLDGNKVIGSFAQTPKGQDEKYFAIRYLTAIVLNHHNEYDVSQAYSISGRSKMMTMLYDFAYYVQKNDIIWNTSEGLTDAEFVEVLKKEDDFLAKLEALAEKYGEEGNCTLLATVRLPEVQKELRRRLIQRHHCKCLLCDITNEELLIASHIKPASECDINGKGDLDNAFLLCAMHDKLFDRNLITFDFATGQLRISRKLTHEEITIAQLDGNYHLPQELMTPKRVEYLIWHNDEFTKKDGDVK